jgi:SAM-dependent methyltransferase
MTDNELSFQADCPICERTLEFRTPDDYHCCRSLLRAPECPLNVCAVRERAMAAVVFELYGREGVRSLHIHEPAPTARGLTLWLQKNCPGYVPSGYFPGQPFGENVGRLRNEDLHAQTFADATFDLVLHLDVLEHLFRPFEALREIERTLKPGGRCLMTAPTYAERVHSEQVAFEEADGKLRIVGTPEYHGNPQDPSGGALVTWRYGYDLPLLISRNTGFDVEVRRWQSRSQAIMGAMTEVYVLRKPVHAAG